MRRSSRSQKAESGSSARSSFGEVLEKAKPGEISGPPSSIQGPPRDWASYGALEREGQEDERGDSGAGLWVSARWCWGEGGVIPGQGGHEGLGPWQSVG